MYCPGHLGDSLAIQAKQTVVYHSIQLSIGLSSLTHLVEPPFSTLDFFLDLFLRLTRALEGQATPYFPTQSVTVSEARKDGGLGGPGCNINM